VLSSSYGKKNQYPLEDFSFEEDNQAFGEEILLEGQEIVLKAIQIMQNTTK